MRIEKGSIVKATAGRDGERFFLVTEVEGGYAFIVDGKTRKLSKPKKKNPKHLKATLNRVDCGDYKTDKAVRAVLHDLNYPESKIKNSKGDRNGQR